MLVDSKADQLQQSIKCVPRPNLHNTIDDLSYKNKDTVFVYTEQYSDKIIPAHMRRNWVTDNLGYKNKDTADFYNEYTVIQSSRNWGEGFDKSFNSEFDSLLCHKQLLN